MYDTYLVGTVIDAKVKNSEAIKKSKKKNERGRKSIKRKSQLTIGLIAIEFKTSSLNWLRKILLTVKMLVAYMIGFIFCPQKMDYIIQIC